MALRIALWVVTFVGFETWTTHPVAAYTLKYTASGGVVRWPDGQGQVVLLASPELKTLVAPGEAERALRIAIEAWRGYGGSPEIYVGEGEAITYSESRRGGGIYVLSPWPYESDRLAVTVTSYYPSGQLVGVDVVINGEVDYALLPDLPRSHMPHRLRDKHDLASVLTHEFGHVLGLDESDDDSGATMWPFVHAGEVHQRTLAQDDEDGIVALYSVPMEPTPVGPSCAVSEVGAFADVPPANLPWTLLLLALGLRRYGRGTSVCSVREGAENR